MFIDQRDLMCVMGYLRIDVLGQILDLTILEAKAEFVMATNISARIKLHEVLRGLWALSLYLMKQNERCLVYISLVLWCV
jgi:hypothetical protein